MPSNLSTSVREACFPGPEYILLSIGEGIYLHRNKGHLSEVELLQRCRKCLQDKDIDGAAMAAEAANYYLMADAIRHFSDFFKESA